MSNYIPDQKTLNTALEIVKARAKEQMGIGAKALSTEMEIPLTQADRILKALEEQDLIVRDWGRGYTTKEELNRSSKELYGGMTNEVIRNLMPRGNGDIAHMAKLIAMHVRNSMEDFHTEHLSDAQMSELNPIIRNAIYEVLLAFDDGVKYGNFIHWLDTMIPTYWEEPTANMEDKALDQRLDSEGFPPHQPRGRSHDG